MSGYADIAADRMWQAWQAARRTVRDTQAECAPRALTDAIDLTIKTLERQLDLITERAPGNYLDKTPIVRSLRAHKQRLERAIEQAVNKGAGND
ncbi:hypothetical protein BGLT_05225 [Caballeronia glathei]|nr:hypothetical protein BGLT_05225 [Caballeronia glathei]